MVILQEFRVVKARNSNLESRNKSKYRITKIQNVLIIGISNFEFVSDFEFRASDFINDSTSYRR
jgi:hypothetical protein